jgi:hypothetical protein
MSIERKSSDRRKLRAGMVFVGVVAGTALIGWGGLAAWQAVTQNNGSTAITLGVHMQNSAQVSGGTAKICTDQNSPSACGAIFAASGIVPGWGPNQVGSVAITNTGTESSNFQLSLTSATVSGADGNWSSSTDTTLCGDLVLTITDSQTPTPATVYHGTLAAMPAEGISDNAGQATWVSGAANTFNFSLSLPGSGSKTDEDSTCTAVFTWGQNGV